MIYKDITSAFAKKLLNSNRFTKNGKYEPKGRFLHKNGSMFVAIDNSTGEAWTEEFKTEKEAVIFLIF